MGRLRRGARDGDEEYCFELVGAVGEIVESYCASGIEDSGYLVGLLMGYDLLGVLEDVV